MDCRVNVCTAKSCLYHDRDSRTKKIIKEHKHCHFKIEGEMVVLSYIPNIKFSLHFLNKLSLKNYKVDEFEECKDLSCRLKMENCSHCHIVARRYKYVMMFLRERSFITQNKINFEPLQIIKTEETIYYNEFFMVQKSWAMLY